MKEKMMAVLWIKNPLNQFKTVTKMQEKLSKRIEKENFEKLQSFCTIFLIDTLNVCT